jgi:putative YphP/YqiW family bacilliredoxin
MYDSDMVQPMRDEVTRLGVKELRSPTDVDAALGVATGTALVFVNSVCGCAAGNARPALSLVMKHPVKPSRAFTVFAGQDRDATMKARSYFGGQPPSSPAFALLKDGKIVHMVHRHNIEGHTAEQVASDLTAAFETHCK